MSVQQNAQTETGTLIFVTHVEAEDAYLKIWGQVDKNSATCVERMILPLAEHFSRNQGCTDVSLLRVNALCCARFQNEGYYRGRILSVRQDGMTVIQFIDYGNVEILPPQEIHLLDGVPGTESLQTFPPVAFDFILMNVLPVNGVWENKIVESIKKNLWYNEYKILIHSLVGNDRFIKLWYNNEDFSELLVKRNMAAPATLQDMFRVKCQQQIYQQPTAKRIQNCAPVVAPQTAVINHLDGNNVHPYHQTVPSCCDNQKHQGAVQEALVFKSRVLDVGSKHEVYVSFVEDGPQKFSVQVQSTSQILRMLMRDINSHPLEPLREPPLPGSVCLGRYTGDKVLCRAVVMSVMENKCKLYYVDFGHTEVLPYTDIFQLPPHYINPKVLSIRFTLSGVKELHVTDEMKDYFKKIVSAKLLVLHVRPPEGPPLVQYGDLYDNGNNIKDILRQAFPAPSVQSPLSPLVGYQEPQKLSKGSEEFVLVSFVESCGKFFVQLESGAKPLESIMNCLAEFCKTAPMLNPMQIVVGLPCAALFDSQWYRAQILSVSGDSVRVLYVDYGNEETVGPGSLRVIHGDLVRKLQAQAIRCVLHGWEVLQPTDQVSNQFEQLTLETRLRMRVVDVHADCYSVDLYDPNMMENVKSHLLYAITGDKTVSAVVNAATIDSHHGKADGLKSPQSENPQKYPRKSQHPVDTWQQPQNGHQDRPRSKTWKDEHNEERRHDSRSNFYRPDARPDAPTNKPRWSPRTEDHDDNTFFNPKQQQTPRGGGRGGKTRTPPSRSNASEKSWSDKDSDASSSRGGNRRGRPNLSQNRRSTPTGRSPAGSRWPERDSRESRDFRDSPRTDFSRGRSRERRGQGYRLSQGKASVPNESPRSSQFRIPDANVVVGSVKTCEVVYTNSPLDFFIQLSPDYEALDVVMEQIAQIHDNGGGDPLRTTDIRPGAYCVARYQEDSRWYRAQVKAVDQDGALVQFIDYGNTDKVELNSLKTIRREFVKLPVQAIQCRLLGAKDTTQDSEKLFTERTSGKVLQVEFLGVQDKVYTVVLREDGSTSVNEAFCDDLAKARSEFGHSGPKPIVSRSTNARTDYAPLDSKWTCTRLDPGSKRDVIITWLTNPGNFYCQMVDRENEFRTMMNEIQRIYAGREPVSGPLEVGSAVIAVFAEDGALYRAEVLEPNKGGGHLVKYVDFGNTAVVPSRKIYQVERKLLSLPGQAVQCSLTGVRPKDGGSTWSNVNQESIDRCFNADRYQCTFHEVVDRKYMISLVNDGKEVADLLIERGLASGPVTKAEMIERESVPKETKKSPVSCDVQRVEINLLTGQTIRARITNVESTEKFFIQLPTAPETERIINEYMANKETEMMERLSGRELCPGTGCLVRPKDDDDDDDDGGGWRRAVISGEIGDDLVRVTLIDTGVRDLTIRADRVLALPGELSVMQNQAIECRLTGVQESPELNEKLRGLVQDKEAIVQVEEVNDTRLTVKLFDPGTGSRTTLADEPQETTSPICPMPILSSSQQVFVSYADSTSSVWLQRTCDSDLLQNLYTILEEHYSTGQRSIIDDPAIDTLCVARLSDGCWYRAKVISVTGEKVVLKLIDHGHNEETTKDQLMTMTPRFHVPHRLAISVSLPVTLNCPVQEQLRVLQEHLSNKELTAVFRRNSNNGNNVNSSGNNGNDANDNSDGVEWVVELIHDGEKISERLSAMNNELQRSNPTVAECRIQEMAPGSRYNVYVSHVDSPSQFWLQSVDQAEILANKQEELQALALNQPEVEGVPEDGSLCAAVYSIDNQWYRARVLDADEDITTVRFVDYGNTDVIDNKSGKIRRLPDDWLNDDHQEYAVKCRLGVVPADSEDWSEVVCERFDTLVQNADSVQAVLIANGQPLLVDLYINNKSLTESLVEEFQGLMIRTEGELIDEIVDLVLDPRSAFVSHVNGPDEFWVQEEKSVGDLEVMSDRFMVADMFPKVDLVEPGLLCVAKYPEDEQWYRAKVLTCTEEKIEVIYIDYGNSAISTEIREIPNDLATVPPLSRKCALAKPLSITGWSEKACEEFVRLSADGATIFLLDVLEDGERSLVNLTLNGENVADLLSVHCTRFEERLPPLGEENTPSVLVTRIQTPDCFWIRQDSNLQDTETMAGRLLEASATSEALIKPEVGSICAVSHEENGQWHRAEVLIVDELGVQALCIDHGHDVTVKEVRNLPDDLARIPGPFRRCGLRKPDTMVGAWPETALEKFRLLSGNGTTLFQLEIPDCNEPDRVRLFLDGKSVSEILLEDENTEPEVTSGEEPVTELTVDQIIQSMERNEDSEEPEVPERMSQEEKPQEGEKCPSGEVGYVSQEDRQEQIETSDQTKESSETAEGESSETRVEEESCEEGKEDGGVCEESKEDCEQDKEKETCEESKEAKLSEESKEEKPSEEGKEAELSEESKEAKPSVESKEEKSSEESEEAKPSEEGKEAELSEESKEEKPSVESKKEESSQESKEEKLSEDGKEEKSCKAEIEDKRSEGSKEEESCEASKENKEKESSEESKDERKEDAPCDEIKEKESCVEHKEKETCEVSKEDGPCEESKEKESSEENKEKESSLARKEDTPCEESREKETCDVRPCEESKEKETCEANKEVRPCEQSKEKESSEARKEDTPCKENREKDSCKASKQEESCAASEGSKQEESCAASEGSKQEESCVASEGSKQEEPCAASEGSKQEESCAASEGSKQEEPCAGGEESEACKTSNEEKAKDESEMSSKVKNKDEANPSEVQKEVLRIKDTGADKEASVSTNSD